MSDSDIHGTKIYKNTQPMVLDANAALRRLLGHAKDHVEHMALLVVDGDWVRRTESWGSLEKSSSGTQRYSNPFIKSLELAVHLSG